jgi:hypothetical protein
MWRSTVRTEVGIFSFGEKVPKLCSRLQPLQKIMVFIQFLTSTFKVKVENLRISEKTGEKNTL